MTAVEDSLRRLGVDHIDVYQVHRPDPTVAIDETVAALSDLVRAGTIRAWGTSTFPAEDLVEAHWAAERHGAIGPHTEQPPYSILCRGIENDVLPTVRRHGMGTLAWSPLSGGWLTGKYRRGEPSPSGSRGDTNPDHFDADNETKYAAVEHLQAIADGAGLLLAHLALAFVVEHPAVTTALIGPRTDEQLAELLRGCEVELSTDVLDAIDAVVPPGMTINPADIGWVAPGLAPDHRRR